MDSLFRANDLDIFAEVACITTLEDTNLAGLAPPDEDYPEDDLAEIALLSKKEKIKRAAQQNAEVRAATSQESVRSYEEFKAEKHFANPLNIRHVNNLPFTGLLRMGTNVCCYYQEDTR